MNGVSRDFNHNRKVATLLKLRSTKIQKTMNPQKFQEQILNNAVQMDASVNFQLNGNMLIVPCPWEDDKEVTNGERVRYHGGIEVDADGRRHDHNTAVRPTVITKQACAAEWMRSMSMSPSSSLRNMGWH